jgi:hypothetical protein
MVEQHVGVDMTWFFDQESVLADVKEESWE